MKLFCFCFFLKTNVGGDGAGQTKCFQIMQTYSSSFFYCSKTAFLLLFTLVKHTSHSYDVSMPTSQFIVYSQGWVFVSIAPVATATKIRLCSGSMMEDIQALRGLENSLNLVSGDWQILYSVNRALCVPQFPVDANPQWSQVPIGCVYLKF